jgi:type II secretory pathway pseudopilin PulG
MRGLQLSKSAPAVGGGSERRGESGAVLLILMVAAIIMMILMGRAAQTWTTVTQREREAEFISRGRQIAYAIERFQADNGSLPTTMKQLLEPGPKGNSRYLRQEWKDPLTGGDWVLLWLAPDGTSFLRSDGRPSVTGTFRATPGQELGGNQATSINLQQLTIPIGSPSYDPDKTRSLLDAYRKSTENPVGTNRSFGFDPGVNLGTFDTGSDVLSTPGLGPIVGVATAMTGQAFREWKGRADYGGYEISIFSFSDNPRGPQTQSLMPPERNIWEMPGTPIPDPLSPEGKRLRNTDTNLTGGAGSLDRK